MRVERLIDDVLLRMGENPDDCLWESGGEDGGCTLRQRILQSVEEAAANAVSSTPRMRLTGWRPLPADRLRMDEDGRGVLPLPDDFLLLYSVRLSSWERPATEALGHDSWLRKLQRHRWHGLRGVAQRPLAFFGIDPEAGLCLELFSGTPADTLAEGWYMPAPRITAAGEIEIPPAAYGKCVSDLATLS